MMKKLFMIAALMLLMSATMYAQTKKVGLLIGSEEVSAIESADERAAAEWFQSTYPEGVIVTPETLSEIANLSTLWVAIDRIGIPAGWTNLPESFRTNDVINALAKHVKAGGSLLLTNHATQLTVPIGRIDAAYAPNIFGSGEGGDNSTITTQDVSDALGGLEINECANVGAVTAAVAEGANEVGTVYYSDTYGLEDKLVILEMVPYDLTGNVIYPAAQIVNEEADEAEIAAAADFAAFLASDAAKEIFEAYYFDTNVGQPETEE